MSSPLCRYRKPGPEMLSKLPKVTQPESKPRSVQITPILSFRNPPSSLTFSSLLLSSPLPASVSLLPFLSTSLLKLSHLYAKWSADGSKAPSFCVGANTNLLNADNRSRKPGCSGVWHESADLWEDHWGHLRAGVWAGLGKRQVGLSVPRPDGQGSPAGRRGIHAPGPGWEGPQLHILGGTSASPTRPSHHLAEVCGLGQAPHSTLSF